MTKRTVVVIPARYESSRFPGKPLVDLLGKPMIIWVAELSAKAVGRENVYVATDDSRISSVVEKYGFKFVMTGPALTGTDRVAMAAEIIDADIYVNVQGDEPAVNPEDIKNIISSKYSNMDYVINGYSRTDPDNIPESVNIPKVVTSEDGRLIYMSRALVPSSKNKTDLRRDYKKQVCIYAFTKSELRAFYEFGRKSETEQVEDIEILRYLDLGIGVLMIETRPGSVAVDTVDDIEGAVTKLRTIHKDE